jgi:hypothetical protein
MARASESRDDDPRGERARRAVSWETMRGWKWALCTGAVAAGFGCSLGLTGLGSSGSSPPDGRADDAAGDLGARADTTGSAPDADGGATVNDASALDAGTDAAPDGAPAPGGPSRCGDAGLLFCDGFEEGGSNWAANNGGGGTSAIDPKVAYRGTHSMHAHTDMVAGGNPDVYGLFDHADATWPSTLYVRAFVYFAPKYPGDPCAYVDLSQIGGQGPGVQLNVDVGNNQMEDFVENVYGGPNHQWPSASAMPFGEWVCVELFTDGNQMRTYVWDAEVTGLTQSFGQHVGPLQDLNVGLSFYQANMQPKYDVWIDEIAVNNGYIGCNQ